MEQPADFDALRLDLKGLGRVYVATWPYIFAQIRHFLALLSLNLALLGFGTAVAFLGFDVLLDSVGRAEPLSGAPLPIPEKEKGSPEDSLYQFLILRPSSQVKAALRVFLQPPKEPLTVAHLRI